MEKYQLYNVVPYLLKFIDNLTNVYVRYNRKRLKGRGAGGDADGAMALATLFDTLLKVRVLLILLLTACVQAKSLVSNQMSACAPSGRLVSHLVSIIKNWAS